MITDATVSLTHPISGATIDLTAISDTPAKYTASVKGAPTAANKMSNTDKFDLGVTYYEISNVYDENKYTASVVKWYNGGNVNAPGSILPSNETLSGATPTIVYINNAKAIRWSTSSGTATYRAALTAIGTAEASGDLIKSVAITVTPPAVGAIPDVPFISGNYVSTRIYAFYRAGILTGSNEQGIFEPDSNIKRSEVAAILTRMFDSTARKSITL